MLIDVAIMLSSSSGSPSPSVIQHVSDRRRGQRARLGASVTITVAGRLVDALGADVSLGGMRIVASATTPAKVGDEVSLVFFLDGDIVSARGVVRWNAMTQRGLTMFGVLFTAIEEDGASVVATYCHSSVS